MIQTGINIREVNALRDKLIEGVLIKTPLGRATLIKKYPNYAHTDKGNWKWAEVYLAEQGTVCEDREKLVKEIPKSRVNDSNI
jgi:hypothetical protein